MSTPVRAATTFEELTQRYPEGSLCDLIEGEVYITPAPAPRHKDLAHVFAE